MPELLIAGGYGGRIEVGKGQTLEVQTVAGRQICDFFAFNRHDPTERLSPAHIRAELRRLSLRVGDLLVSCLRNPMLELVEDTHGIHDITFPPCDPVRYERGFGLHGHRSCRTNLAEVMAEAEIPYGYLPDPINFFQNFPITPEGEILRRGSIAKPGDKVVLLAHQDLIVAGSACPMIGVNGDGPTPIRFVVR